MNDAHPNGTVEIQVHNYPEAYRYLGRKLLDEPYCEDWSNETSKVFPNYAGVDENADPNKVEGYLVPKDNDEYSDGKPFGYLLVVPSYKTSFTVTYTVMNGENESNPITTEAYSLVTDPDDIESDSNFWKAGYKYTYVLNINPQSIEFSTDVTSWEDSEYYDDPSEMKPTPKVDNTTKQ